MKLIDALFDGALDIVGDVHGEYQALMNLLEHLGYSLEGDHPDGRRLVFLGDLCDRGPDSVSVIRLVRKLVDSGKAQCLLGNHELNLLNQAPKVGSGWWFETRYHSDTLIYGECVRASAQDKAEMLEFLSALPLALERSDLRLVHAAWEDSSILQLRQMPAMPVLEAYRWFDQQTVLQASQEDLLAGKQMELANIQMENAALVPQGIKALPRYQVLKQNGNPVRVLTSGVEREAEPAHFTNGAWRFTHRVAWWETYQHPVPVLFGHYWRLFQGSAHAVAMPGAIQALPFEWMGKGATFCLDYSVGARYKERKRGLAVPAQSACRLGAMRWPEQALVFDCGTTLQSQK